MAQNVKDCALLQEVISTYDPKDSTSIDFKRNQYSKELTQNIKEKKLEYLKSIELMRCQKKLKIFGKKEFNM